jgi:hypothetical protein
MISFVQQLCIHRFFRLPRSQLAYVRFIVEAYEGLAQMRSLPGRGDVEWVIPAQLAEQAAELARALQAEVGLRPIQRPPDWPPWD